jgi:transposase-like protein
MPFQEQSVMEQKREFVVLAEQGELPFAVLCRRFGISRPAGYKWWTRYLEAGEAGLSEQSRRPQHSPQRTPDAMEAAVVAVRQAHPHWGGAKIRASLVAHGQDQVPSARTCTAILARQGLLTAEAPRQSAWQRCEAGAPNALWHRDFRSPVPQRQGRLHPLSVLDDHSRFLVGLEACADQTEATCERR